MTVIAEVTAHGQSIWFDYIQRNMIWDGTLHRMVLEDSVRGVTSNPAIFNKAIGGSKDYAPAMRASVASGGTPKDVFERIAITDIQMAADVLFGVYNETNGLDGYVSLEVSPYLAYDSQGTIEEAERLWTEVARENVMIKIPATEEGLVAIEHCIASGINVNVTLLFSVETYEAVAWAYIRGLEARAEHGGDLTHVASVASFFISRIDALIEKRFATLESDADAETKKLMQDLSGKIAIANAKVAYQSYKNICENERFKKLVEQGAQPQRLLWASTGTKNPEYSDVLYVEELIGPETVNTVPEKTFHAFKDHGKSDAKLLEGIDEASALVESLKKTGVDLNEVTSELLDKGVIAFADAFDELLGTVESRRSDLLDAELSSVIVKAPNHIEEIDKTIESLRKSAFVRRLWLRDSGLYAGSEKEDRWGWMMDADELADQLLGLSAFAEDLEDSGVEYVVWLGTGGSSRSARVFSSLLPRGEDAPHLFFLESTHPESIQRIESQIELDNTAFIVASKSGTTAETRTLADYFWDKVGEEAVWYAITDPDTALETLAEERNFAGVLHAEPDVGGRFASLIGFGLGAPALLDQDLGSVLFHTEAMIGSCHGSSPAPQNPGVQLGAALGVFAKSGYNKLTLSLSRELSSFGPYLQQLVDESLGKDGKGLVVIDGESITAPEKYGNDRLFVSLLVGGEKVSSRLAALEAEGHPHIEIRMDSCDMIGQQFFLWHIAVSTAAHVLEINPFDQPNVELSKKLSREFLNSESTLDLNLALSGEEVLHDDENVTLFGTSPLGNVSRLDETIVEFAEGAGSGAYAALLAYVDETNENEELLQALRLKTRNQTNLATTLGFGPSYLHASGQLHKGGPDKARFIVFTPSLEDSTTECAQLLCAQAAGDVHALRQSGRNVLRVQLKSTLRSALGSS